MNQRDDAFEAELTGWRPSPVSEMLKQRIGQDVGRIVPFRRRTWMLVGTLAAACLLTALLLRMKLDDHAQLRPTITNGSESPTALSDSLPSLQAYTKALNQSTEALDALLDRHGSSASMSSVSSAALQAFSHSRPSFTN